MPEAILASIRCQLAEFVGLLQKEGKVTAQSNGPGAKAMGPTFEKSFKKLSKGKSRLPRMYLVL
jgi:hypothetical protein